jgi:hypothetical protein
MQVRAAIPFILYQETYTAQAYKNKKEQESIGLHTLVMVVEQEKQCTTSNDSGNG